jgi:[ribosomal protein S18]-alanine N-acetyltransferase
MSVSEAIKVRFDPLDSAHLDAMMEIEVEAYPEPWTRGMFRGELGNRLSRFYVAFQGEDLVGYAGFWLVLNEAHITSVTVAQRHRHKGIGRQLLRYLLDRAVAEGAQLTTLEVRPTNRTARKLYESAGFRAVGVRKGYYTKTNEDALIMAKDLHE